MQQVRPCELPPLRRPTKAPVCPQLVDPGIDVLAHCLIRRLGTVNAASGIKRAVCSLLHAQRPLVMILSYESAGPSCDAMLLNLAALANVCGVPVVWALSREHMAVACGSPRGTSAVAVLHSPDVHADALLQAMLKRAYAAELPELSLKL